jgi:hypothetical protein
MSSLSLWPTWIWLRISHFFYCDCLEWLLSYERIVLSLESYITTDDQSTSPSWNKASIWGLRQDSYYCQTVSGLLMWGALSDERTGLFTIAAGPRQHSHSWVRVPLDSWLYFTVSDIRDFPFRRLLRLAGLRWRYSTPPPYGVMSRSSLHGSLYSYSLAVSVEDVCCMSVVTETRLILNWPVGIYLHSNVC